MEDKTSRLVITLTIIALISGFLLAFVYQWTTPLIKKHQVEAQEKAVLAVLPGIENFKEVEKGGLTFYEGYKDDKRIGVAMATVGGGFQGMIRLMIGVEPISGKIYGIRVLEHQETPGLGANITGKDFEGNFIDKPFGTYKVVKRPVANSLEVEAISGATISSTKVTKIVEEAIEDIQRIYGGEA